jgi:transposase
MTRAAAGADRAPGHWVGGDLAAGTAVLLSAQGMNAAAIAKVAFTSEDRVRDVIRNFNADGFGSLYPKYKGGRALPIPEVQRWPGAEVHPRAAAGDQEDRQVETGGP